DSMQQRHAQLSELYASGAIGLTRDGMITLRDAKAVPLAKRQAIATLVAEDNKDRGALYREIALANGHPEWEQDVRATFAQRWVHKANPGWWYQDSGGGWVQK
ncbi:MAG: YdbL family protein, partial [Burkholderiales bacterium]